MKKGINLSGLIKLYKNERGYYTYISNKFNDNWERMSISVSVKGGEVGNDALIEITKGFISFYKTRDGLPRPKIVIMEYEVKEAGDDIDINVVPDEDASDLPF